jgi:hypothetical protein
MSPHQPSQSQSKPVRAHFGMIDCLANAVSANRNPSISWFMLTGLTEWICKVVNYHLISEIPSKSGTDSRLHRNAWETEHSVTAQANANLFFPMGLEHPPQKARCGFHCRHGRRRYAGKTKHPKQARLGRRTKRKEKPIQSIPGGSPASLQASRGVRRGTRGGPNPSELGGVPAARLWEVTWGAGRARRGLDVGAGASYGQE